MQTNQLEVILKEQNVAADNAKQLLAAFGAPFEEAGKILAGYQLIKVTEEDQFALMAEARSKRITLSHIRGDVERKRKELKEDSLRTGRAIDSVAKFVKEIIEPAEEYLKTQEKFAEIKAAERAAALKAKRIEQLMQFTNDVSVYNLDAMTEEQFNAQLRSLREAAEAKASEEKRLHDEQVAREQAEAEERRKIQEENARLKKEADEREAAAKIEREAAAAKQAEIDAAHAKEMEAARAKAESERKERERLEQEKAAREAAEAKARADTEEAQRQALLAPDKEKLLALAASIEDMALPALSSKDAQAVLDKVDGLLRKVSTYIRGNVKGL